MPGFWGQYGPKVRSAEFLGPVHYARDHFDYNYKSSTSNNVGYDASGIIKVHYTYSSLPDVPNLAANDNVIIPMFFMQSGQRIASIRGVNIKPPSRPMPVPGFMRSMGVWLYSSDFRSVWDQKLWEPSEIFDEETDLFTDVDTRSLCEMGPENLVKMGYPNLYRYVDLGATIPPFRNISDNQPEMPRNGHYICLCVRQAADPIDELLLQVTLTIMDSRHASV